MEEGLGHQDLGAPAAGRGEAAMEEELRRQDEGAPTGAHEEAESGAEDFVRLVKLLGRAFYEDIGFNGDELTRNCSNNHGIVVVVLDYLTRYKWVIEKNISKALKIRKRDMIQILRFLEEEMFLERKKLKLSTIEDIGRVVPTPADVLRNEEIRRHCCCLDYAKIYDVTRYRLRKMREKLKYQLDSKNSPPQYLCQNCDERYSAFDMMTLPKDEDGNVQCNMCYKVVVAIGAEDIMALVSKMKNFEEQLKPLLLHLEFMKNKPVPDLRYVHEAQGLQDGANMSRNTRSEPSPVLGEATAEAPLYSFDEGLKIIPDWLIRQGMLSEEDTFIQVKHEYAKAYYDAWKKKMEDGATVGPEAHEVRKVGHKSKRYDEKGS